jgi:hypothetical protein
MAVRLTDVARSGPPLRGVDMTLDADEDQPDEPERLDRVSSAYCCRDRARMPARERGTGRPG